MKNWIGEGRVLNKWANTSGAKVASGSGVIVGSIFGVAKLDIADGKTGPLDIEGVFELPKAAGVVLAQGAACYWNDTAKNITDVSEGNTRAGIAFKAAASAAATVQVKLNT